MLPIRLQKYRLTCNNTIPKCTALVAIAR